LQHTWHSSCSNLQQLLLEKQSCRMQQLQLQQYKLEKQQQI
jgi:hypothetical protein